MFVYVVEFVVFVMVFCVVWWVLVEYVDVDVLVFCL